MTRLRAREGRRVRERCGLNARERPHALEREVPVRLRSGGIVGASAECGGDGQEPARVEADVDVRRTHHPPRQQGGEHQQHDRSRGLHADERRPQPGGTRRSARLRARAFERRREVVAHRMPRRSESCSQSREHRYDGEKQIDAHVGSEIDRSGHAGGRRQDWNQPDGEEQTGDSSNHAERQALCHELPDDAAAGRAERQPYAHLPLTRDRTGQQKVRDVDAGQQQHETNHGRHDRDDQRNHRGSRSLELIAGRPEMYPGQTFTVRVRCTNGCRDRAELECGLRTRHTVGDAADNVHLCRRRPVDSRAAKRDVVTRHWHPPRRRRIRRAGETLRAHADNRK